LDNGELSVLDTSVVGQTVTHLRENGFLLLKVPRSNQEQLTSVFDAARQFFRQSNDVKEADRRPKDMGYRPYAGEYSKSPLNPDQVESFSVAAGAIRPVDMHSESAHVLCERMLTSYDILESIAEELIIEMANRLTGSSIGISLRGELHRWSRLQLNYSTPSTVDADFINESHEDGALLTIAHAREPGLELEISNGEFLPITNLPNNVLVIPGDIVWLLSGGWVEPMFHRVRPVPDCPERMALLFFGDINPRLCEPWVRNELNENVDVGALVLKNPKRFGLEEWDLD
jgi:isopenicillin N synthase-like dioxygenase